jgi:outer membrane protein assembly factor BamB
MVRSRRCDWVVCLGIGLLTFLSNAPAWAQGRDADHQDDRGSRDFAPSARGISLPTDLALARRLEAAPDYIKQESWVQATHTLQALLDTREDVLVCIRRPGADGKEVIRWVGVRSEANRLVGYLPARGREFYEMNRGPQARALLTAALRTGDTDLLAEVARRYFYTAAGAEATRLVGLYHLDRGRFDLAALYLARLLDRAGGDRLPPDTLFAAALAFRRAGNEGRAGQIWNRLAARAPAGVHLGDRLVGLPELEKKLARLPAVTPGAGSRFGGEPFRAAASRSGQGFGSPLRLETRWAQPTAHEAITREWVQAAIQRQEAQSQPVFPASVPVPAGDRVIYRSHRGIHAVDRQSGQPVWEWASAWGLDRMVRELRYQPYLMSWVNGYMPNNPNLLFENAALGRLGTDGTRVYAVDDLPLPPFPISSYSWGRRWAQVSEPSLGPDLSDAAHHSRLLALDAESGKLVWEIGGRGQTEGGDLHDSFFLGPPLPLDGRLYGMVEKNQELRLVCLDAALGSLLWAQALALPLNKLLIDVGRRVQPLPPAYADGMLVCPTNAGVVLGVDLFHRNLAWAYLYTEETLPPDWEQLGWGRRGRSVPRDLPRLREEWKAAAPLLHGDKVVLTAPDAPSVHCLDLHSGALLWKASRTEDDLYLAGVFGDKVLIVGKQSCRALGLADGKPLWAVETGLPSGRGVAAGGVYYVPLKAALPEKLPAVYAIDLEKGTILARTPAPRGEEPGNLVLCGDEVLSQTALAVTAYARHPNDTDRGK